MPNYAKITLLGHVGQDPRAPSENHRDFITFSFAVTEKWKDKSTGERKERTDWYECITSQTNLAAVVRNYVKKGNPLYIEGTPKYGTYKSKDGETKVKIEVNINKLVLLGDKQDSPPTNEEQDNSTKMNGKYPLQQKTIAASSTDDPFALDDEIPF